MILFPFILSFNVPTNTSSKCTGPYEWCATKSKHDCAQPCAFNHSSGDDIQGTPSCIGGEECAALFSEDCISPCIYIGEHPPPSPSPSNSPVLFVSAPASTNFQITRLAMTLVVKLLDMFSLLPGDEVDENYDAGSGDLP